MKKYLTSRFGLFNVRALLAVALCSAGAVLTMFSFVAIPTPGWSIVTSANAGVTPTFNSVACSSASDCWAVGQPSYLNRSQLTQKGILL